MGKGADVINSIDAVSSDLSFDVGTCGKDGQGVPVADAQPTIRIPSLLVGSK
jgi:TldD protein